MIQEIFSNSPWGKIQWNVVALPSRSQKYEEWMHFKPIILRATADVATKIWKYYSLAQEYGERVCVDNSFILVIEMPMERA